MSNLVTNLVGQKVLVDKQPGVVVAVAQEQEVPSGRFTYVFLVANESNGQLRKAVLGNIGASNDIQVMTPEVEQEVRLSRANLKFQVVKFLQADKFVNAIKHVREVTGCGLKEAKHFVDAMKAVWQNYNLDAIDSKTAQQQYEGIVSP
jgi:ribosomal protein L7/L12